MKDKQLENDLPKKRTNNLCGHDGMKDRRTNSALCFFFFLSFFHFSVAHQKPEEREETRYQK